MLGALREQPPYYKNRSKYLKRTCEFYGVDYPYSNKEQECVWFNTGVLVVSRVHKELFNKPKEVFLGIGWVDMPLINAMFIKYNYQLYDLGVKFNYTTSLALNSNRPFDPKEAFIFHATTHESVHSKTKLLTDIIGSWDKKSRLNKILDELKYFSER